MKYLFWLIGIVLLGWALYYIASKPMDTTPDTSSDSVMITPITHASLALGYAGKTLYADPTGDAALYTALPPADVIVVTHDHQDHFSTSTLGALVGSSTALFVSQEVMNRLPENLKALATVIANGETKEAAGFSIEAIPAYNMREADKNRHVKGEDNGYVITAGAERIYIAGDTEDIPEMRALRNIDIAFVPMNLPYTMSVESAADAVLEFKPKKVYPYHYRTPEGFSDVAKFKQLVNAGDTAIEVVEGEWYPE